MKTTDQNLAAPVGGILSLTCIALAIGAFFILPGLLDLRVEPERVMAQRMMAVFWTLALCSFALVAGVIGALLFWHSGDLPWHTVKGRLW
jgi:hypothetical protein